MSETLEILPLILSTKEADMLKIKIFDKPEPEKTLMLNTEVVPNGTLVVFACDEAGQRLPCGDVWGLRPSGQQVRPRDINPDLGLDLDDKGKIREA